MYSFVLSTISLYISISRLIHIFYLYLSISIYLSYISVLSEFLCICRLSVAVSCHYVSISCFCIFVYTLSLIQSFTHLLAHQLLNHLCHSLTLLSFSLRFKVIYCKQDVFRDIYYAKYYDGGMGMIGPRTGGKNQK